MMTRLGLDFWYTLCDQDLNRKQNEIDKWAKFYWNVCHFCWCKKSPCVGRTFSPTTALIRHGIRNFEVWAWYLRPLEHSSQRWARFVGVETEHIDSSIKPGTDLLFGCKQKKSKYWRSNDSWNIPWQRVASLGETQYQRPLAHLHPDIIAVNAYARSFCPT